MYIFIYITCLSALCVCVLGLWFPVNRLFDLLFEIRDQYNETLLKKWAGVFQVESKPWYLNVRKKLPNDKVIVFVFDNKIAYNYIFIVVKYV